MRKTIFSGVLMLALVVGVFVSPYGMRGAANIVNAYNQEEANKQAATDRVTAAENSLVSVVQTYNDSREFGVFYDDLERLVGVLKGINGIDVQGVVVVDPTNNYVEDGYWHEGTIPSAVKFKMVVSDVNSALSVLTTMELPVAELYIQLPNTMEVIFLTGGEV